MCQYGLLLEDYADNGEFVNDCIFTLMHHVGGELGSLITLFQPKILKTFTSIWKSEFEICDVSVLYRLTIKSIKLLSATTSVYYLNICSICQDWSDLVEYVINTFIKKPHSLQSTANFRLETESFDDDEVVTKPSTTPKSQKKFDVTTDVVINQKSAPSNLSNTSKEKYVSFNIFRYRFWKHKYYIITRDI